MVIEVVNPFGKAIKRYSYNVEKDLTFSKRKEKPLLLSKTLQYQYNLQFSLGDTTLIICSASESGNWDPF